MMDEVQENGNILCNAPSLESFSYILRYSSRSSVSEEYRMDLSEISSSHGASMKMTVFWDAASRSLVETDRRFRDAYCLIALIMKVVSTSKTSVNL
jgi:hypothetical protein